MALINCMDCKAEISDKAQVCPNCGCPVKNTLERMKTAQKERSKKNRKELLLVMIPMIVIVAIICIVSNVNSGYYMDYKWGMTSDEVQNKLKEQYPDEGSSPIIKDNLVSLIITDYDGYEGLTAMLSYEFEDDSLDHIDLYLSESDELGDDDMTEVYIEMFTEEFGEPVNENNKYVWKTKNSRITLIPLIDDLFSIAYDMLDAE